MHRPWHSAALVAAALLSIGCDAGDAPEAAGDTPDAAAPDAVEFASVNRSGINGTVTANHDGDEATVTVTLEGLEAGVAYPVHIHGGRCAAGGPVEVPLGRITASAEGTGRLTSRVAGSDLSPDSPAFVQAHGPDGAAVACADIPGHDGAVPLTDRATDSAAPSDSAPVDPSAAPDEGGR